jgi:hypothetical protein
MSQQQPPQPAAQSAYPLVLRGDLTEPISRGLWIVKWLLGIPHFFILACLWVAVYVVTVISFFSIVFTGIYPQSFFNFVVGTMRWTWRVGFWSYQALGTDKYPPFSFAPDANYPADLYVMYPEKLSQGLVWVKWWLLAIPHYIIITFFVANNKYPGLVEVLTIFAGIGVLFTGKYHKDFFRFIMGMNRWSYRVFVYTMLMTDKYPPFNMD